MKARGMKMDGSFAKLLDRYGLEDDRSPEH